MKHPISVIFYFSLFFAHTLLADQSLDFLKDTSQNSYFRKNLDLQNLVDQAGREKLFEQPIWNKLLHYEKNIFFSVASQIKDPAFFLSVEGHKNNDQEMIATLIGFFAPIELKDKHPICKYPARLNWLKQKLKNHPAWNQLPQPTCYYFDVYLRNLNAESISFVFSSYYANNPGSAFGHTFFRVNKKSKVGKAKQELLDYGISYAAQVTTGNSLLYMINGLTGGFKGTYISVPYYYKVREYNDYESRDLWAYELNLTHDEVTQVLNHMWEIGPHYFDYYFFTQNCSYHMLTVLEAASERIKLTDKVPLYVIPSDSVKALFKIPDFVRKTEFRPSLRKHFEKKWDQLENSEKDNLLSLIQSFSEEKIKAINFPTQDRKALFYDAFIDYADMKDPKGIADRQGQWHTIKEFLLVNRAEIPVISEESLIPLTENERPEQSHPSARVTLGIGEQKSTAVGIFQYRFAFHDLLDNSRGLPSFSQLEFFNFKFQMSDGNTNLQSFSFFNILQLNPLKKIDPQLSWGADLGIKNMNLCSSKKSCLGSGLKGFAGYSIASGDHLFWALSLFHYRYGNQFEGPNNYISIGYQLGYLFEFSQKWKVLSKYEKEIPNQFQTIDSLTASSRFNFKYNQAIELEWQASALSEIDNNQTSRILYHYYF